MRKSYDSHTYMHVHAHMYAWIMVDKYRHRAQRDTLTSTAHVPQMLWSISLLHQRDYVLLSIITYMRVLINFCNSHIPPFKSITLCTLLLSNTLPS